MPALNDGPTESERRRLNSWKEIAAHAGRDVRTVLRWHKDRGLPVHRVPGGHGRTVFAYVDEIEGWLAQGVPPSQPARPSRHLWRLGIAVTATFGVLAMLDRVALPGTIVAFKEKEGTLVAIDDNHRERWSIAPPKNAQLLNSYSAGRNAVLEDLDGDGKREILVRARISRRGITDTEILYCLSETGHIRWSHEFRDRLTFAAGEYGAPWVTEDLVTFGDGPSKQVAVAVHHGTWWPGMVVILDATGRSVHRFTNAGWIVHVARSADGRHLLATGVNNAHDAAVMAVLDSKAPDASSPEAEGSPFRCINCSDKRPLRYFVLPRSELNRLAGHTPLRQGIGVQPDGTIELRIPQNPANASAETLYEFSPSFAPLRATHGDIYWDWHRRLEQEGKIGHSAASCPEGSGLKIKVWDPGSGWREYAPPAATEPTGGS